VHAAASALEIIPSSHRCSTINPSGRDRSLARDQYSASLKSSIVLPLIPEEATVSRSIQRISLVALSVREYLAACRERFLDGEGIAQRRSPVLRNTRHNVTIVRFNDDDRSDWSRPAVIVAAGIMHRLMERERMASDECGRQKRITALPTATYRVEPFESAWSPVSGVE